MWRRITDVLPTGEPYTVWELGFKQYSFHHVARVLQNLSYNVFRQYLL
jgi:hypothetical protein